jgi:hypothetical protein
MKNIVDVLRSKEQEILRIRKELDALRITARLLADEGLSGTDGRSLPTRILAMPESDELLDLTIPEQPTA